MAGVNLSSQIQTIAQRSPRCIGFLGRFRHAGYTRNDTHLLSQGLALVLSMEPNHDIDRDIKAFKQELSKHSAVDIVRSHILSGECFCLSHEKYYDLRNSISSHFMIHPNEVILVGSAKLGFSTAPGKEFRPFGDSSDLDVAIISPVLFDRIWVQLYDYSRSGLLWKQLDHFEDYLFRGWMRPDFLPQQIPLAKEWWKFFLGLTTSGQYEYQVRGGLYKSWHYLECYHVDGIEALKLYLGGQE